MIKALLLLLSAGKFGKVFLTGGSMLVSVVVYAWIYGWRYAVGFVGLMLAHEMGHYVAARQKGLNVGAPTFIPFVGAWINLKDMPRDAETEAYIGLAGPLVGTLAALGVYWIGRDQAEPWLLALAYAGFILNLFNLIPLAPFDGGRITAVLSPRIWLLGVPMLIALFLQHPSPLLIMMAIVAAPQVMKALRHDPSTPEAQAYYGVASLEARFTYGVFYLGLAIFLALMAAQLHTTIGIH
ncbi:MAG: site-2 protease family protein [Nevskia sp.]|jgi:Zn-dependent protease|nr:site-2 protease family protein [Nevskia sp.]MCK9385738.1 site-2 protease family protein [Nevskia sp.]